MLFLFYYSFQKLKNIKKEIINASIPVLIIKHVEISKYIESYNSLINYLNEELINSKTYLKYISRLDK